MVGHFQEFEDEYLETMYEFYESDSDARVRTGQLASRLGVSPASATEMVQRLAQRGYLCLLYTSPSPRDVEESRMPSSA